jgi:alpha-beta hydrolase superfamily lysophospholipase
VSAEVDQLMQIVPAAGDNPIRGVALVIHGLNLKPAKMQSIIDQLTAAGIEVYNCSLRGHGRNFASLAGVPDDDARLESFRQVTYQLWRNETLRAYQAASTRCRELQSVPMFFIGYSLGALMGCELLLTESHTSFDRMVLFAPALRIQPYSRIFQLLSPFPRLVVPSASPACYRANRGTPIAAYTALYTAAHSLAHNASDKLDVPTLLFIDSGDELVSTKGIMQLIETQNLTEWEVELVSKDATAQERYRHLIIDERSVGASVWQEMMASMAEHLLT